MKTMAIRLDDQTSAQLTLVAQLEATSVAELIRQAIERLLAEKRDQDGLQAKAEAALAEIDQDAQARRDAIQAMLRPSSGTATPEAPKSSRARSGRQPNGPKSGA
jgi:Arc/MetJ-type ribon-helix-helix transcriptional regulator